MPGCLLPFGRVKLEIDNVQCPKDTSIAYTWAKETNGIAVTLEHRYFGESAAFGARDPTKQLEEYAYLTLDNVMADGVAFMDHIKQNITGAQDSKVIVLSGTSRRPHPPPLEHTSCPRSIDQLINSRLLTRLR
jgi:hypothetical protein